jgi:hypothetical protein
MAKFKELRSELAASVPGQPPKPEPRPHSRSNKRAIVGYFSPELSRELRELAAVHGVTMQALIGEGLDLLLHRYGKHPFGER